MITRQGKPKGITFSIEVPKSMATNRRLQGSLAELVPHEVVSKMVVRETPQAVGVSVFDVDFYLRNGVVVTESAKRKTEMKVVRALGVYGFTRFRWLEPPLDK